jgi:hypothetical protein
MKAAILLVGMSLLVTPAHAQCGPANRGTEACPTITAPAETSVPGPSMGGTVVSNTGTPLFGGWVPPNGFMAQLNGSNMGQPACWINDNPNPTNSLGGFTGFVIGGTIGNYPTSAPNSVLFVTPPGYKPLGPLMLNCNPGPWYVEVRAW